ncbi:MAG: TFIIB-type zinc ribbon-containing protein [Desulfurococcales archaeon]|nr:TFIIB-type zinc ribbon-containing protein [Desulfurococcales archaeon]
MLSCMYCGSTELVHDLHTGYVVCSSCGSVLEIIYESESEALKRYSRAEGNEDGRVPRRIDKRPRRIGYMYKIYRRVVENRRLRKGVVVRADAIASLAGGGKLCRLFTHMNDGAIESLLDRSPILRKVLDIMRDYPSLYSRTTRGKIATAYIAAKVASKDPIMYSQVSKFFGLSKVHIRRIKSAVENTKDLLSRIMVIEDLSRELLEVDRAISEYLRRIDRDAPQAL